MSEESFRRELEAGQSCLRRAQYLRAWSLVAGIYAAILSLGLSAALTDIGFPRTMEHLFFLAWVVTAWLGAIALLASGLFLGPTNHMRSFIYLALWAGNLAVVAGLAIVPIALPVVVLPIGVGAMLIKQASGNFPTTIYSSLPLIASLCSLAYQNYENAAI